MYIRRKNIYGVNILNESYVILVDFFPRDIIDHIELDWYFYVGCK